MPIKTLSVGTFRSAFVSFYYPRMNNMEKTSMSALIISKSFLKFYTNPNDAVMSTARCENKRLPSLFKGRRERTGHLKT
jgi:hypothetical protein